MDSKYQGERKGDDTTSKKAQVSTSSFFDFSDRHTSHLSSPAAQSVEWSERQGIKKVPKGISKPTPSASTSTTNTFSKPHLKASTTSKSSSSFNPSKTFQGPRTGWIFKSGTSGVGYYTDTAATTAVATTTITTTTPTTRTEHQDELKNHKVETTTSSFFDFSDRHTSHLSSPAAQSVEWSDRQGIKEVPAGISKVKSEQTTKTQHNSSVPSIGETKTTATPYIPSSSSSSAASSTSSSASSSAIASSTSSTDSFFNFSDRHTSHLSAPSAQAVKWSTRQGIKEVPAGISKVNADSRHPRQMITTSYQQSIGNSSTKKTGRTVPAATTTTTTTARKLGSIPGYRRPTTPASSSSSSTSSPAYDIIFIMNQLALGKISQSQFDILNSKLM
jgi:hypothetical protein